MNRNTCVKLTFITMLVLAVSTACAGQVYAPQPFSADMAIATKTGQTMTGKFYFSPPAIRQDFNSKGHNVSTITDGSTQTTYQIIHEQRMYMVTHGNQTNPMMGSMPKIDTDIDPNNPCSRSGATCKKAGTETVNGRVCDKWISTSDRGTATWWIDQKLHFPIKSVNTDGSTMEFTNVVEGKPDASLFQPPAGYRKMDMPGMMGGRPSQ